MRHKVGDVVGSVKQHIGSEWGGAKVKEAEAEMKGEAEIEYLRVRPAEGTLSTSSPNMIIRAWSGQLSGLGWPKSQ